MKLCRLTLIFYMLCSPVGHLAADTPVEQAVTRVKTYQLVDTLITQLDALQVHSPKAEKVESAALLTTDQLPDDVWGRILEFCLFKEILTWAHVSKHLRKLIRDKPLKTVWEHKPVEINVKRLLFVNPATVRLPAGIVTLRLVQEEEKYKVLSPRARRPNCPSYDRGRTLRWKPYDRIPLFIPWLDKQRYLKNFSCEGVNCLMELPTRLANLQYLEVLNISYCKSPNYVRGNEFEFADGKELDWDWDERKTEHVFPRALFKLKALNTLTISYDLLRLTPYVEGHTGYEQILDLPNWFGSLPKLTTLVIKSIGSYNDGDREESNEAHYEWIWEMICTLAPNLKHLTFENFSDQEQAAIEQYCPKRWRNRAWRFVTPSA